MFFADFLDIPENSEYNYQQSCVNLARLFDISSLFEYNCRIMRFVINF